MTDFKMDFSGEVKRGIKLGTKLEIPTLNLPAESVSGDIEQGVYICKTKIEESIYMSIMHFGPKSIGTDDPNKVFCEIHVFDFDGDLYNKGVQVQVLKKIRNVRQFESESELKEQIQNDIEIANNYFKNA